MEPDEENAPVEELSTRFEELSARFSIGNLVKKKKGTKKCKKKENKGDIESQFISGATRSSFLSRYVEKKKKKKKKKDASKGTSSKSWWQLG